MSWTSDSHPHSFHIPVMGTGFTLDTPLRVARFGISSVVSLVDDVLIEQLRKHYAGKTGEPYEPITDKDPDPRANRITAYLNLMNRIVTLQVNALRREPFTADSEITKYFEMLPDSPLRNTYLAMRETSDPLRKAALEQELRSRVIPGAIDANIMTKLDCNFGKNGSPRSENSSDAKAALRGFARSSLNSSIVLSAGMNRDLYSYFSEFDDFYPDAGGRLRKHIILKVSDFRSALIQGKFLASRGLWISEYRIESGLNCGGHAFATKGYLLGPIMEEFSRERTHFVASLDDVYRSSLEKQGRIIPDEPGAVRITVQGGIGTAEEQSFILRKYGFDGTGWGTPFLLVPEAVSIDEEHLATLSAATGDDVYLSDSSPLDVPFWNLRTSGSEEMRRRRIRDGHPGSPCLKGYLRFSRKFGEHPLCKASSEYQRKCLAALENVSETAGEYLNEKESILSKSCICHDLGGATKISLGIDHLGNVFPAICSGPNIVNFTKIASLREMVDHIYGRISLLSTQDRPNLFVRELMLYIEYFRHEVERSAVDSNGTSAKYLAEFKENLLNGIEYYRRLSEEFIDRSRERFLQGIDALALELEAISLASAT